MIKVRYHSLECGDGQICHAVELSTSCPISAIHQILAVAWYASHAALASFGFLMWTRILYRGWQFVCGTWNCQQIDQMSMSKKNLVWENRLLLTSGLGLHQCLVDC